jgi:hypothetical protein
LPFRNLAREPLRFLAVDLARHLLDEAQHVAHAKDARRHALRLERFERLQLLADTDEQHRLAGHVPHRERGATARVAVGFRQHDTRQIERGAERARGVDRILARHAVDDEQRLDRSDRGAQRANFVHHRFVDVQPARRVDEQHVVESAPRFVDGSFRDVHRRLVRRSRRDVDPELLAEPRELQHRGGTMHVGADHQRALALARLEPQRKLRRSRRLAGALKPREQHDRRRLRAQVERTHALAHHAHEFLVDHADERLARRQALVDLEPDRSRLDGLREFLDDRKRDVRLEQRHAHLPQRVGDVLFSQPSAAAQAFDDGGKSR